MQHLNHLKIYYFFNNKVWKIITNHALKRRVVLHTTFSPLKKLFFHLLVKLLARKSVSGVVFILIIECLPRNGSITIVNHTRPLKCSGERGTSINTLASRLFVSTQYYCHFQCLKAGFLLQRSSK